MCQHFLNWFRAHYHTHYRQKYTHHQQLFVFDTSLVLFGLLMVAASLFFFFWKPGVANQVTVTVSTLTPHFASGDQATFLISYVNKSSVTLSNPQLTLHWPAGFIPATNTTAGIFPTDPNTVILSAIPPGGHGTVTVSGQLWVPPGMPTSIGATLSYFDQKNVGVETSDGEYSLTAPTSLINTVVTFSTTSAATEPIPFTVTLLNTTSATVSGLSVAASQPNVSFGGSVSNISLPSGAVKTISGVITPNNATPLQPIDITSAITVNGQTIPLAMQQFSAAATAPLFSVTATLTTSSSYFSPSDQVPLSVTWQNNGNARLTGLQLRLGVTPGVIDINQTAALNHVVVLGNEVVINQTSRSLLASAAPGSSGTLTLTLVLLPHFTASSSMVTIQPIMEMHSPSQPGKVFATAGAPITLPLATEVSLTSTVRYYSDYGDQVGRGPLPPEVGKTTKYWAYITIGNTINPLTDATFVATFPNGVTFGGDQSVTLGAPAVFNSSTNELTWTTGAAPANSQTGIYFSVAATPAPSTVGQPLTLIKQITFTGTDATVGKIFTITTTPLTNVLPERDQGASAGAAVAPAAQE